MPPGRSYRGPLTALTESQEATAIALRRTVTTLAERIGPRALEGRYAGLLAAEHWLASRLSSMDYEVDRQAYEVKGRTSANLAVEITGTTRADEIVIVGAHYDSVTRSPGANDNASGVAALLALAWRFRDDAAPRTLRFVLFTNEEQPYAWTPNMGSYRYAQRCRNRGENIIAMLSLDEIGCYSTQPGSQKYVFPLSLLYPSTGDFVTVVTNTKNRHLMDIVTTAFRRSVRFPIEGLAMQLRDVGRSDHWGFWQFGYPGVLITDTANFRYKHYHQPTDTPDRLDYERLAHVVDGLEGVLKELNHRARERDALPGPTNQPPIIRLARSHHR